MIIYLNMNDVEKRIKQIDNENIIWIIYFFLIGLCIYGNKYEKKYFYTNDENAKNIYRKITIIIFVIAIAIYIYFFIDSYSDVMDSKNKNNQKSKNLNKLNLLGSTLILISGIIFLYIAIVDTNLDTEIAFN